ncbi:hypothetical protein EK21DRAFT_91955 [Setomelanomma holmii]|uniref:Uncharacterized protein n=1 Tax=Setomelanomma holmii TaxID=210430 RepID=A0A9P4H5A8_9PLEO|nr:hypothetical protein EK21DRAFT_91955 [Setomelanomma holmii]
MSSLLVPTNMQSSFYTVSAASHGPDASSTLISFLLAIVLCVAIYYLLVFIETLFPLMEPKIDSHNSQSDNLREIWRVVADYLLARFLAIKGFAGGMLNSLRAQSLPASRNGDHGPNSTEDNAERHRNTAAQDHDIDADDDDDAIDALDQVLDRQKLTILGLIDFHKSLRPDGVSEPRMSKAEVSSKIKKATEGNDAANVPILVHTINGVLPPFHNPIAIAEWSHEQILRETQGLRAAGHEGEFVMVAVTSPDVTASNENDGQDEAMKEVASGAPAYDVEPSGAMTSEDSKA